MFKTLLNNATTLFVPTLSLMCHGQIPMLFILLLMLTEEHDLIHESSADSVKIEWNGQTFELPLITLDTETQSLVDRLSKSAAPSDSSKEVQKWTDTQGRTIEAKFVKADKLTLTIDWNGKVTTLPLTMFSASSRKLAAELQNQGSQVPSENEPDPKIDLLRWTFPRNIHGKTLLAKQLTVLLWNLQSELKILMNGTERC